MYLSIKSSFLLFFALFICASVPAQTAMEEMWDKSAATKEHANIQWFKDAKFGLFIHWGLYSQLAGEWNGKRYYGSGEWIMHQAKIPAADYAKVAAGFNPVNFNAQAWVQLATDAGIKYVVITAKHHDGFAMYDSKVSDFDIVDASPYRKDPMKELAQATRQQGIQFGFYYSQFLDWHEPNGGRNNWDFDESKKDYQQYYRQKAIPQLKELMTNYGPLGLIWFDLPGGMDKNQTQSFINELRVLQPQTLFSSRVGQGLGDYRDFGDSELPATPIGEAWESIYTHNDSWGYIKHDMNFKSSAEIIRLLATVASKGGNLMLNVGPDGDGNIPVYSVKYLQETGKWLKKNGESIYSSTFGFIPPQPWGVTTAKPGRLFLHLFHMPRNGELVVPGFGGEISKAYTLVDKRMLPFKKKGDDLVVNVKTLPETSPNTVVVLEYKGKAPLYNSSMAQTVSAQFDASNLEAVSAQTQGKAFVNTLTYSHYFGDWKHVTCLTGMSTPADKASFQMRVLEPGDYKVVLEYACPQESANQEGSLRVNNQEYLFRTLRSSEYERSAPLLFIKHPVAIASISQPGNYTVTIQPLQSGKELFKLKTIILEPVH